jgi:SH3-like domain-containing protein
MTKATLFLLALLITSALPQHAQAICVKVKKANLRSGPSTKNQISWEVFKYMPLRKIKTKGSWIKVRDFEGDTHWVYKTLVTSKFQCAVVKVEKANLRTGPGSKYKKPMDLPSVEKYTVFKLDRVKGQWAKVTDSFGDSYWVFRKLIWIN